MEEVRKYYDSEAQREWQRLSKPYTQVEYKSTLHLIEKYFPQGGKVLDIGAGPGRYSLALLERGYEVSLLDLSQNELDIAKQKITEAGYKAEEYYCRSAMNLEVFEEDTFDALLVMGPMYHLHSKEDRQHVLREAKRIVKPEGIVIAAYINTWGALKASLREFPESFLEQSHFEAYIAGDLSFSAEESFTETFFTQPTLAVEEVKEAGFKIISRAGAESFLAGLNMQMDNLAIYMPEAYSNYVMKAAEYCELPQYRDATEHLIIIAEK